MYGMDGSAGSYGPGAYTAPMQRGPRTGPPASYGGPGGGPSHGFIEGKLFLGGLERITTKESVMNYCSQWGDISDAVVMQDRNFGFVTFVDPKNAQAFLEQREHVIDGRKIEAKAAVPKTSGTSSLTKKMFVGGTGEVTDEEFRDYFSQFGQIEDAAILRKDGVSRGFGFVTFTDEVAVEKCLVIQHALNGKRVEIKRAVPKEAMAVASHGPGPGYGRGWGRQGSGQYPSRPPPYSGYMPGPSRGYGMSMASMQGYQSVGYGAYPANDIGFNGYGYGGYGRTGAGRGGMANRYAPY